MKETKKALIFSGFLLVIDLLLITGTTFAWFTDSIVNQGNTIVTGTLMADLMMDKDENGNYSSIIDGRDFIFSNAEGGNGYAFEPGQTAIVYLAVKNNGQLNMKYNIDMDVTGELAEAMEYALIDDVKADTFDAKDWEEVKEKSNGQTGNVKENISFFNDKIIYAISTPEESGMSYFAIAMHMKKGAGEEMQEKSVTINLEIHATQVIDETNNE